MKKSKIKKIMAIFMVIVMMSTGAFAINAANPEEAGKLPIRDIFEDGGAAVEWRNDSRTIHIEISGNNIVLHTCQPLVYINDVAIPLQDGITLWEGRSFITQNDLAMISGNLQVPDVDVSAFADIAISTIEKFVAGDIFSIWPMLTEEFQALGIQVLLDAYNNTLMDIGSFSDWDLMGHQVHQSSAAFYFTLNNVVGSATFRIVVNFDGAIDGFSGFNFAVEPMLPAENARYTAYPIVVGEETMWELDGLLTMPNEACAQNPVPAVVLVHGTGEGNMDLSLFDNRPFHDIATYLSSNGIAVLRYNKRNLTHGIAFAQVFEGNHTVWEETIEDALLAARILQADPRISRVYVAGLSLGGTLAPRIAEEGGLDGVIILAGSARPIFEASYDQNIQLFTDALLAGQISQEEADTLFAMVADMLEEAWNLPNLTQDELQGMEVFGFTAAWQLSVMNYLPLPIISRNPDIPTLILHGTRDWQTHYEKDFRLFEDYTRDYAHVTAILYYNVNHILMQSQTSYNDLRDYAVPGHVYMRLLRDMVDWINRNK